VIEFKGPITQKLLELRSMNLSAPATWNNIPASIRDSGTLDTFKTALKTHLFNSVYNSTCHAIDSHPSIHSSVTYGAN